MKIDNLKVGMIIKNYKSLCELLEIEAKKSGSNSYKAQFKELERYCKCHKEGRSIIIDEIYNNVKEKVDKRGGNNQVFKEDFKKLMIYMLHRNRSERMLLSKGSIFKATNLVNDNYLLARTQIPKLSEIVELPQSSIYEFYDYNATKLRETVERNLKACRRESLLIYETVTAVAIYESVIATNVFNKPIIDDNGNLIYQSELVYREATKEECQKILELEQRVKLENNWIDNKDIFLKGKWKQFKQEVEKRLKEANTNIKFYYEAYRITWNNKYIDDEYNKYCKDIEKSNIEKNINDNMIKSINRSTKARHTKASKDTSWGTMRSNKVDYQASDSYIQEQEQLTLTLIDIKSPSLKNEFEKLTDYKKINKINKSKIETEQLELDWNIEDEIPF